MLMPSGRAGIASSFADMAALASAPHGQRRGVLSVVVAAVSGGVEERHGTVQHNPVLKEKSVDAKM